MQHFLLHLCVCCRTQCALVSVVHLLQVGLLNRPALAERHSMCPHLIKVGLLLLCLLAVLLHMQLLSATNLELSIPAADVLTQLAACCPDALEQHAPAAVAGLTELMRECASHSYTLSSSTSVATAAVRRHSFSSSNSSSHYHHHHSHAAQQQHHQQAGSGADGLRRPSLSGMDSPMSPIPEASLATAGSAAAEQAAGTVWTAERVAAGGGSHLQQQADERTAAAVAAAQQMLRTTGAMQSGGGAGVLRHPSLNLSEARQQQQQQRRRLAVSSGGTPMQDHLMSRHRPHQARPWSSGSSCLVCSHSGQETCSFCFLSSAVRCVREQGEGALEGGGCWRGACLLCDSPCASILWLMLCVDANPQAC